MKVITRKTDIVLGGKKYKAGEVIDACKNLESKDICSFFKANNLIVPRKARMVAIKAVLDPQLRDPEVKKNLTDEVRYRLNFYKNYTETQLINVMATIINDDLKSQYLNEFWKTLISTQAEIKLTPEMLEELMNKGAALSPADEDFVVFNENLNPIFADSDDQIDGISIEAFRATLVKSSTLPELRQIGAKFDIDVPRRIKKNQLVDIIVDELEKTEQYTEEEEAKLKKMSVLSLQRYAKEHKIKASIELKKEDIIEYIINQYDQDTLLKDYDISIFEEKSQEELEAEARELAAAEAAAAIAAKEAEHAAEVAALNAVSDEETQRLLKELAEAKAALEEKEAEAQAAREAAENARLEAEEEAARRAIAENEAERIAAEKEQLEKDTLKKLLEEKDEPVEEAVQEDNAINEEVLRRLTAIQEQVDALGQQKQELEKGILEEQEEVVEEPVEEQVEEAVEEPVEEQVEEVTEEPVDEFEIPEFDDSAEPVEEAVEEPTYEEPVEEEPVYEEPVYEEAADEQQEELDDMDFEEIQEENYTETEALNEVEDEAFEAPEFEAPEMESEEVDETFDEGDLETLRKRRNDDNEALKRRKIENDKDLEKARKNDQKLSKKKKHSPVKITIITILVILLVLIIFVVTIGLLGVFDKLGAHDGGMYKFYMKLKNDIVGKLMWNDRAFYTWAKGVLKVKR